MKESAAARYASNLRKVTYTNLFLLVVWVLLGTLTVLIPVVSRTLKMKDYNNMYYLYNWEDMNEEYQQNQQEYYEQQYGNGNNGYNSYNGQNGQQNGQNGNYNGQNGQNGDQNAQDQYWQDGNSYTQWEQMTGKWDLNDCRWYQISCYPYYINEDGQPEPTEGWYPGWFSGWSSSEEEREQMQENGETSMSMKFIYVWQLLMFLMLLTYGCVVVRQKRIVTGLLMALFVFTNMSFLSMWMLADGSIYVDGDYVQRRGFYGQFSVLIFMCNAWYVLFGVIFLVVFGLKARRMNKEAEDKINSDKQMQLQQPQQQYYEPATPYKTLEGGEQRVQEQQQPTYTQTTADPDPPPALDHNGITYVTVKGALS